jgi:hypothetical protein
LTPRESFGDCFVYGGFGSSSIGGGSSGSSIIGDFLFVFDHLFTFSI